MLRLINIEKTPNTIKAEYIPEDSNEIGLVELSQNDEEIISSNKTSLDGISGIYLRQAASSLRKILLENEMPKTRLVMWY